MIRIRRLDKFPRSQDVRKALLDNADSPPDGAVAQRRKTGGWGVLLFGTDYTYETAEMARRALLPGGEGSVYVWRRVAADLNRRATRDGSRTDAALALLSQRPDLRPIDAAREVGVDPAAVYRALQRTERSLHCPHCGERLVGYVRA